MFSTPGKRSRSLSKMLTPGRNSSKKDLAEMTIDVPTSSPTNSVLVTPGTTTVQSVVSQVAYEPCRCPHHRGKVLDLYCKVHKELICSNCTVTRHHECHKHPSLHNGDESVSPFQPIEDAADELQASVEATLAEEKVKEDTITEALRRVMVTKADVKQQVSTLSVELEAYRDLLVEQANAWCEHHIRQLENVGTSKQETLDRQSEDLQAQIDLLANHQRNILNAVNFAKSKKAPEDMVTTCLKQSEKVSPIAKLLSSELEPVEKANLIFRQDGKDRLLEDIANHGWTGTNDNNDVNQSEQ